MIWKRGRTSPEPRSADGSASTILSGGITMSTKDQYVEKRQAEIDKWNAELEKLEAKIREAGADAKAKLEHEEQMNALRQKRDEVRARLAEIQAAGDDRWEDLKDGLEHPWTSIKDGFEKIKAKF
jgi:septal ring factor EnvC (AmiA/AmiB activator)